MHRGRKRCGDATRCRSAEQKHIAVCNALRRGGLCTNSTTMEWFTDTPLPFTPQTLSLPRGSLTATNPM